MSLNFHILGNREIIVKKTGKTEIQTKYIDIPETPTRVTEELLKSSDPVESFLAFIESKNIVETISLFDPDDFFCENPIGKKEINFSKETVEEIREKIRELEESGYEITFEAF